MIDKGADVNERDKDGNTPLIKAARYGYADIVKLLIDKGAAISKTLLLETALKGNSYTAKILLSAGAKFTRADFEKFANKYNKKDKLYWLLNDASYK